MSQKTNIQILHDDDDFVIINKPPRFLSIPDRFAPEKQNAYGDLSKIYGKMFIVHRLDKETSGILCFAKNAAAHKHLSQQFEGRSVEKSYLVILDGKLPTPDGVISAPIAESRTTAGKMVIARRGKPSVTEYKVLEEFRYFTLVEAKILTGRMHQIRVHFESIGYPLAVDAVYGKRESIGISDIKNKGLHTSKFHEEVPLMNRSSLHSHRLTFTHPRTQERVTFECEMPKDFHALVQQLRKWGLK